jgi:hypothetical protein
MKVEFERLLRIRHEDRVVFDQAIAEARQGNGRTSLRVIRIPLAKRRMVASGHATASGRNESRIRAVVATHAEQRGRTQSA